MHWKIWSRCSGGQGDRGEKGYGPEVELDLVVAWCRLHNCRYIWREFSLAVTWPSPFGGHLYSLTSSKSSLLLTALQCSLLLADTIIGGCKVTPPNRQIKVTAKYKSCSISCLHAFYRLRKFQCCAFYRLEFNLGCIAQSIDCTNRLSVSTSQWLATGLCLLVARLPIQH